MERRILKDFHIGSVENSVEQFRVQKEPPDIFTQLAKAMKSKKSERRKRKEWNVLVKQRSLDRDPIGSSKELQNRRSLRKSVKVPKSQSADDLLGTSRGKNRGNPLNLLTNITSLLNFINEPKSRSA